MSREQSLAKARADRYFSLVIRSAGVCERCGETRDPRELQCAHMIRRRFSRTRCVQDNAWCLCPPCHLRVDTDPAAFMELVDQTVGRARYDELYAQARDGQKVDWIEEAAYWLAMWQRVREAA